MSVRFNQGLMSIGIALSALSVPSLAQDGTANNGFYGTASAGFISPKDITHSSTEYSTDLGFSGEFGFGYRFSDNFRTEFSYSTNTIEVDNSTTHDGNVQSFLGSVYYDFDNESKWVPYLGGGIGIATLDTDLNPTEEDSAFGYQGKLGLTYKASNSFDVFAEAVYQGIGETTVGNAEWGSFGMWGARFGTRFKF
tara:strand:+ start:6447 stop:7031 length:585 start_codon:yes stop_codon:yes gene_type:complete